MINVLPKKQKILLNNASRFALCTVDKFKDLVNNCTTTENGLAAFFSEILNLNYEGLQAMLNNSKCIGECLLELVNYKHLCMNIKIDKLLLAEFFPIHSLVIETIQDGLQIDYDIQLQEKSWLSIGVIALGILFVVACIKISINSIYHYQLIVLILPGIALT
jgi:hypothetical protein